MLRLDTGFILRDELSASSLKKKKLDQPEMLDEDNWKLPILDSKLDLHYLQNQ